MYIVHHVLVYKNYVNIVPAKLTTIRQLYNYPSCQCLRWHHICIVIVSIFNNYEDKCLCDNEKVLQNRFSWVFFVWQKRNRKSCDTIPLRAFNSETLPITVSNLGEILKRTRYEGYSAKSRRSFKNENIFWEVSLWRTANP